MDLDPVRSVLAIDMSKVAMGWAVLEPRVAGPVVVASGSLRLHETPEIGTLLLAVECEVGHLMAEFPAAWMAIEEGFAATNGRTSRELAMVQGAARMAWAKGRGGSVLTYPPASTRSRIGVVNRRCVEAGCKRRCKRAAHDTLKRRVVEAVCVLTGVYCGKDHDRADAIAVGLRAMDDTMRAEEGA